ncbi:uncharacterized protein K452DRAFT_309793 [Aplosporella prunicola CBS 121167]|uniref:Uncharacterized protein n=1 Tax=Aplosporella prunicola CBS 121167 TaxID=1176127 RepID=A0A6A6BCR6_9PEZI|nr:uncharacterized protein K452DRAFT_309793 [Aplosporella prunicola CBS 121167]KAF2140677.1 hypothetical protein K452DRAFT_309793 [Aplosporella prunicola CBS 121167]
MATPLHDTNPGTVQRSPWKAEAIRRGRLRISGPLPVADSADRPASKRHATPTEDTGFATSRTPELPEIDEEDAKPIRHKRSSTALAESNRPDYHNHKPVGTSLASRPSKRQKRGSLRATLKKIFSKKSSRDDTSSILPTPHEHHHSEPVVVDRSSPQRPLTPPKSETPKSSHSNELSFPVQTIRPRDPLGSHLPFPMNVNAPPQDDGADHEYIMFNRPALAHRRRATLPSLIFSANDVASMSAIWSETGTRVTATDDQSLVHENEIGVAVTSMHQQPRRKSNRRSRSAGALEELRRAQERASSLRASVEGTFWRQSGDTQEDPDPHDPHDPFLHHSVTEQLLNGEEEGAAETMARSRDHSNETVTARRRHPSPREGESQGFVFGPFTGGADSPAALEAAGEPVEPPLITLDERMERLESNMRYFDQSLRRLLNGNNIRQSVILEKAPKGRRDPSPDRTGSAHSSVRSQPSLRRPSAPFTEATTVQASEPVSASSSPAYPPTSYPAFKSRGKTDKTPPFTFPYPYNEPPCPLRQSSRKTSMPNLVNSPSMTTMSSAPTMVATATATTGIYAGPGTPMTLGNTDRLTTLYTLLYQERSARKDLEAQVQTLQAEMDDLRIFVGNNTRVRGATAYPTPSPDQLLRCEYDAPNDVRKSHFSVESGEEEEEKEGEDEDEERGRVRSADKGPSPLQDEDSSGPDAWQTPYETPRRHESPEAYNYELAAADMPAIPVREPVAGGAQCAVNAL